MSTDGDRGAGPSSLTRLHRIVAACDAFEADLLAGRTASIEGCLARVDESDRPRLLHELLILESEYRRSRGQGPTWDEQPAGHPGYESEPAGRTEPGGPDPQATVTHGADFGSPAGPRPNGQETLWRGGTRFRILHSHARGGLGEVFVAIDSELNREVALKEIRPEHAGDVESRARFLIEAEVTGRLEHPGIVPVYSLGHRSDGRPYYAMRFVRGEDLKEAIARFHSEAASDPAARTLGLQSLLRRLLGVCYAIDYAHTRGILHRDLKPANIMLGHFGETLVVDWGLAKPLAAETEGPGIVREAVPGGGVIATAAWSGEGPTPTRAGQLVGTPSYMSPEQAEGREPSPASDVYGLGAILYAILTGKAPAEGKDLVDVIERVRRGDIPSPRSVGRGVDPALDAICRKALALRPGDRYESARALAEDVERWLADEPVSAWREPWMVRARRWGKRHRTLVTSSAAVLVVALTGLSLGLILLDAARRREAELNSDLIAANSTANRRLDQTMEAIRDYYTGISGDVLLGRAEFRELREKLLAKPLAFYEAMARELESAPAGDLRSRSLLAAGRADLGQIFLIMGRHEEAREQLRAAVTAYEALAATRLDVSEYQDGLIRSYGTLGNALSETGDLPGGVGAYRKAIDRGEALAAARPGVSEYQDGLARSYMNLGVSLRDMGDLDSAIAAYRKAIERREALVAAQPGVPAYRDELAKGYSNLGNALRSRGDLVGAVEAHRSSVERREALVAAQPGVPAYEAGLASSYNNLGNSLRATGDRSGAVAAYRKAIERREALVAAQPNVPAYRGELANNYSNLGIGLRAMDDHQGAVAAQRRAIELYEALVAAQPGVPAYRDGLARSYSNLGAALGVAGDKGGAIAADRKAIELREALVAAQPDVPDYRHGLGISYANLGLDEQSLGHHEAAVTALRGAIEHGRIALKATPQAAEPRRFLKGYYEALIKSLQALQRVREADEAEAELRKGEAQ